MEGREERTDGWLQGRGAQPPGRDAVDWDTEVHNLAERAPSVATSASERAQRVGRVTLALSNTAWEGGQPRAPKLWSRHRGSTNAMHQVESWPCR